MSLPRQGYGFKNKKGLDVKKSNPFYFIILYF